GREPGGARSPGGLSRPLAPAAEDVLPEAVFPRDPGVATLPPPTGTAPVVDGSRPLLRADADQNPPRAALAERNGTQPPPVPVRFRGEATPWALLDRVFGIPEPGWLWDRSAAESWLAGP